MGAPTLTWHEVDYTVNNGVVDNIIISDTQINTSTNRISYDTVQVATPSIVKCVIGKFTWGVAEPLTSAVSNVKFWLYSRSTDGNNMASGWNFLYGYIPYSAISRPSLMPKFKDFTTSQRNGSENFTDITGSSLKMNILDETEPVNIDTNLSSSNFYIENNGSSYTPYIFISIIPSYQQGDGFVTGWTYRGSFVYR